MANDIFTSTAPLLISPAVEQGRGNALPPIPDYSHLADNYPAEVRNHFLTVLASFTNNAHTRRGMGHRTPAKTYEKQTGMTGIAGHYHLPSDPLVLETAIQDRSILTMFLENELERMPANAPQRHAHAQFLQYVQSNNLPVFNEMLDKLITLNPSLKALNVDRTNHNQVADAIMGVSSGFNVDDINTYLRARSHLAAYTDKHGIKIQGTLFENGITWTPTESTLKKIAAQMSPAQVMNVIAYQPDITRVDGAGRVSVDIGKTDYPWLKDKLASMGVVNPDGTLTLSDEASRTFHAAKVKIEIELQKAAAEPPAKMNRTSTSARPIGGIAGIAMNVNQLMLGSQDAQDKTALGRAQDYVNKLTAASGVVEGTIQLTHKAGAQLAQTALAARQFIQSTEAAARATGIAGTAIAGTIGVVDGALSGDERKSWKSSVTVSGAVAGAAAGSAACGILGSVVPVVGNLAGAGVCGIVGGVAGGIAGDKAVDAIADNSEAIKSAARKAYAYAKDMYHKVYGGTDEHKDVIALNTPAGAPIEPDKSQNVSK